MIRSKRVPLQNGLLFIEDSQNRIVPFHEDRNIFAFNRDCISILGLHEIDADCTITVGAAIDFSGRGIPDFRRVIATPSRVVILALVLHETIFSVPVDGDVTAISVWVNASNSPDDIVVGIGGG